MCLNRTLIDGESALLLKERNLYGSSRIGVEQINAPMLFRALNQTVTLYDSYNTANYMGDKRYELSNHLGNVLEVITDRKLPSEHPTDLGTTEYYTADVIAFNDYYPYGMILPGRNGQESSADYRYGFQGREQDDEVKGDGNSYTTHFRMLDPRVGRWLSIDPKASSMPWQSPYCSMDNNPLIYNDKWGDEVDPGTKVDVPNPPIEPENMYEPDKFIQGLPVLSEEGKKYHSELANYETLKNEAIAHNKAIDSKIDLINKTLEGDGLKVGYNNQTGVLEVVEGNKKDWKSNEYSKELYKAINSSKRIKFEYGGIGLTTNDKDRISVSKSDFDRLFDNGDQGKSVARALLAGSFKQFNSGNSLDGLTLEMGLIADAFGFFRPVSGDLFDPAYIKRKTTNSTLQYIGSNKSAYPGKIWFSYDSNENKVMIAQ